MRVGCCLDGQVRTRVRLRGTEPGSVAVQRHAQGNFALCNLHACLRSKDMAGDLTPLAAHCPRAQVLIPVANGSEEMEVLVTADVLRRAKADVVVASAEEVVVVARHGTRIVADALLRDAAGQQFDLIVVPASGRQLLCSSPPRYTFPLTPPHGVDCLSRVACRARSRRWQTRWSSWRC